MMTRPLFFCSKKWIQVMIWALLFRPRQCLLMFPGGHSLLWLSQLSFVLDSLQCTICFSFIAFMCALACPPLTLAEFASPWWETLIQLSTIHSHVLQCIHSGICSCGQLLSRAPLLSVPFLLKSCHHPNITESVWLCSFLLGLLSLHLIFTCQVYRMRTTPVTSDGAHT